MDSMCFVPFLNSYANTKKAKDGQVNISISAGSNGRDRRGYVNIDFPEKNYPEFEDYIFVNRLLKKCVDLTNAEYAVAVSRDFRMKIREDDALPGIGWQTYLAGSGIQELLPSTVLHEKYQLGIVISLSKEIVYSDNEAAIAESISLGNLLKSKSTFGDI